MEQFRQIGESLGSLKALMVFQNHIQINQKQCCFLLYSLTLAYEAIAEEMRRNLDYEDRHTKWRELEQPLRELLKRFKEAEAYIKQCFESKDWWAKAILLYQNRDCIEFHIHNLLWCIPNVMEAIESAGESSSLDEDHMQKRRLFWSRKYQHEWSDPKLFKWRHGKQYLVSPEFCSRIETVWKEDRWLLMDKLKEKKARVSSSHQHRLIDLLLKNLEDSESLSSKLLPSSILLGSKDYQVRRRLGNTGQYKEVKWLGESFVVRNMKGDMEPLMPDICRLSTLSHPNILHVLCGFTDEEHKECFLVSELMAKNLTGFFKEFYNPRKRVPLPLITIVDIMLQIARGMEYLHSKRIYHGDLNPSKIFVRTKSNITTSESFLQAKVSGFGFPAFVSLQSPRTPNLHKSASYIWHAPEVLSEKEDIGSSNSLKYTDKSDVYSFAMICFELLTGKIPFEDTHLQGEKMSRNIRAGERPLFPFHSPKYLVTLTKRCWHYEPSQRPSFSSICRILRYIKRFLVMNPDHAQADTAPVPPVDYLDIEAALLNKFPSWRNNNEPFPVSEIPFQMFAYHVMEKERIMTSFRDTSESGSEGASMSADEGASTADDSFSFVAEKTMSVISHESMKRRLSSLIKRSVNTKSNKYTGTPKARSTRPPQLTRASRSLNKNMASEMVLMSPNRIRRHSGHASDSELS
ncbi:hypothetical protein Droror1_Dr00016719 [Drosera rotundifolia]